MEAGWQAPKGVNSKKNKKTTTDIFSVPMWDLNFHAEPEKAEGKKKKKKDTSPLRGTAVHPIVLNINAKMSKKKRYGKAGTSFLQLGRLNTVPGYVLPNGM